VSASRAARLFEDVSSKHGGAHRRLSPEAAPPTLYISGIVTTGIAAIMIALTIGGIALMFDMVRHPRRWESLFAGAMWSRVINWTAAVTVAAAAGVLLGGAADVALATFVVGLLAVTAELRFLFWARRSRRFDD
jgi:hypothetical protein